METLKRTVLPLLFVSCAELKCTTPLISSRTDSRVVDSTVRSTWCIRSAQICMRVERKREKEVWENGQKAIAINRCVHWCRFNHEIIPLLQSWLPKRAVTPLPRTTQTLLTSLSASLNEYCRTEAITLILLHNSTIVGCWCAIQNFCFSPSTKQCNGSSGLWVALEPCFVSVGWCVVDSCVGWVECWCMKIDRRSEHE